jgi:hypothetical protein
MVDLGEVPYAIVGVAPHGFRSIPAADVFTPLRTTARDNSLNYRVLARLRPGRAVADAAAEFTGVQDDVLRAFPRMSRLRLASTSWRRFGDALGERLQQPLLLVLAAVGCLLLIACLNIAGLQLTRALANRREVMTRAAIGASPRRLARHCAPRQRVVFPLEKRVSGGVAEVDVAPALRDQSAGDLHRVPHRRSDVRKVLGHAEPFRKDDEHVAAFVGRGDRATRLVIAGRAPHPPERDGRARR